MPRYARRPSGQRRLPGPWKHGPVPVVGLIGGIGAGKSLVASGLARRGATVLDADAIGHALLDQRPARTEVVKRFGEEVLDRPATPAEGEAEAKTESETETEAGSPRIDRKALGRIVFEEPTALKALESILHPRMRSTFEKAIRRVARRRESPLVVLDAAVLLEAGWDDLCDAVVFVEAPADVRKARVREARGWSAEQLHARQASQWPLERKRAQADHVVRNSGTAEELEPALDRLWRTLRKRPEPLNDPDELAVLPDEPRGPAPDPNADRPPRPGRPKASRSSGPRGRGRRKR